jgi:2-oxoglutarate ferredoxin oxidoreductase subunit alpha
MVARAEGLKVGLLRPISLYPFPEKALADLADRGKHFLVTELNTGQMVEDVRMSVGRRATVHFYGRPPGAGSLPSPEDILHEIRETYPTR